MQRPQRVAIARILEDLIKADRIVDSGEMEFLREICSDYNIDHTVRMEAQSISLAQAMSTVCRTFDDAKKQTLLEQCRRLTVSDGFCAPAEAMLMVTLSMLLDPKQTITGEVISSRQSNFNIDIATALYIESFYDTSTNEAISNQYRYIYKEFQLTGFHFVYIPQIIGHYKSTPPQLFKSVLEFLAPSLSEKEIAKAYADLMEMTTHSFCRDLLCNKCGIDELRNVMPSLLIKIGTDYVNDVQYANYVRLDVDAELLKVIQDFTDIYSKLLSSDIYVVSAAEDCDNKFHFHGFYKQLLDIFLIKQNSRSEIIINTTQGKIQFKEINESLRELNRKDRALYLLFLCLGREGINFDPPENKMQMEAYNRRMKRVRKQYEIIYKRFGGKGDQTPDISLPDIRRPMISHIRTAIGRLDKLYNPADYNIVKDQDGTFSVLLEPALVYIEELNDDAQEVCVPLFESEIYNKVKNTK